MDKLTIPDGCNLEGSIDALIYEGDIEIVNDLVPKRIESTDGGIRYQMRATNVRCEDILAPNGHVDLEGAAFGCSKIIGKTLSLRAGEADLGLIDVREVCSIGADDLIAHQIKAGSINLSGDTIKVHVIETEGELILEANLSMVHEIRAKKVTVRGSIEAKLIIAEQGVVVESGNVAIKRLEAPSFSAGDEVTGIVMVATAESVQARGVRGFLHPNELDMLADATGRELTTRELTQQIAEEDKEEPQEDAVNHGQDDGPETGFSGAETLDAPHLSEPAADEVINQVVDPVEISELEPETLASEDLEPETLSTEELEEAAIDAPLTPEEEFPEEETKDLEDTLGGRDTPASELPQSAPDKYETRDISSDIPLNAALPNLERDEFDTIALDPATFQQMQEGLPPEIADPPDLNVDSFAEPDALEELDEPDEPEAVVAVADPADGAFDPVAVDPFDDEDTQMTDPEGGFDGHPPAPPALDKEDPAEEFDEELSEDELDDLSASYEVDELVGVEIPDQLEVDDLPAVEDIEVEEPVELESDDLIGDDLADEFAEDLTEELGDELGDELTDELGDELTDELGDEIGDELEDELSGDLGDEIGDDLDDDLGDEIGDLDDELSDDLGDEIDDDLADDLDDDPLAGDPGFDEPLGGQGTYDDEEEDVLAVAVEDGFEDDSFDRVEEEPPQDPEDLVVTELALIMDQIRAYFPEDNYPQFINQITRYLDERRLSLFFKESNKNAVLSSFDKFNHEEISKLARSFFARLDVYRAQII